MEGTKYDASHLAIIKGSKGVFYGLLIGVIGNHVMRVAIDYLLEKPINVFSTIFVLVMEYALCRIIYIFYAKKWYKSLIKNELTLDERGLSYKSGKKDMYLTYVELEAVVIIKSRKGIIRSIKCASGRQKIVIEYFENMKGILDQIACQVNKEKLTTKMWYQTGDMVWLLFLIVYVFSYVSYIGYRLMV